MKLMTVPEYAKSRRERGLIGGSVSGVRRAIESGRVDPEPGGLIDARVADRTWEERTRIRFGKAALARDAAEREAVVVKPVSEKRIREIVKGLLLAVKTHADAVLHTKMLEMS